MEFELTFFQAIDADSLHSAPPACIAAELVAALLATVLTGVLLRCAPAWWERRKLSQPMYTARGRSIKEDEKKPAAVVTSTTTTNNNNNSNNNNSSSNNNNNNNNNNNSNNNDSNNNNENEKNSGNNNDDVVVLDDVLDDFFEEEQVLEDALLHTALLEAGDARKATTTTRTRTTGKKKLETNRFLSAISRREPDQRRELKSTNKTKSVGEEIKEVVEVEAETTAAAAETTASKQKESKEPAVQGALLSTALDSFFEEEEMLKEALLDFS